MKVFPLYIRLVRPVNLFIILFTVYVIRFAYILPLQNFKYASFSVDEVTYALFALSFILVAAAGYIINDYYDVELDAINKPDKVIIGKTISPERALRLYVILNVIALCTGFYSCCAAGYPSFSLLFVFYAVSLWIYSYKLKSTFLAGNVLVAICLALVPLSAIYLQSDVDEIADNIDAVHYFAWGLAVFAFLINLIREIVKDMQDAEGDAALGCKTIPIVLGNRKTKIVVQLLVALIIFLLGIFQYFIRVAEKNTLVIIYCAIFIQLPCLVVLWKTYKASSAGNYKKISGWLKFIMITGISICFVFAFEVWIILHIFSFYSPV